jgi:hypothetical protein
MRTEELTDTLLLCVLIDVFDLTAEWVSLALILIYILLLFLLGFYWFNYRKRSRYVCDTVALRCQSFATIRIDFVFAAKLDLIKTFAHCCSIVLVSWIVWPNGHRTPIVSVVQVNWDCLSTFFFYFFDLF